jgi:O-methyltransferase
MKQGLKNFLRQWIFSFSGFYLSRRPRYKGKAKFQIEELFYGATFPSANYAPWDGDVEFQKIYQSIKDYTLVDIYRCYELWQLVGKVNSLNRSAAFIEIGVWRGGTSAIMARKLSLLNSTSKLYMADTFTGVAKATSKDVFYFGGEHKDTSQSLVENLLKEKSQYHSFKILKGIFPEDTSNLISNDEIFGLCHIDVDVYSSAKDIVNWIWDKMIVGGMIVFDDYGFHTCTGVTRFVEEQRELQDRIIIYNLNGHAIMIKIK